MVNCPVCDAEIDIEEDELEEGDLLTCDECAADLRVVGVDPLELEAVEEEEEGDLEYDEEEEEEEDWK
jgi:alpha-aminoadipate carrier protein LysW